MKTKQGSPGRGSPKSTRREVGSNRWVYVGLLASLLLLLGVYFLPLASSEPGVDSALESTNEPLAKPREAMVENRGVSNAAIATAATAGSLVLPLSSREFEVKSEQDELLAEVERVASEYPRSAMAMHAAAVTYAELLQTEKAEEYFKRSLELDGNSPQVMVDYAALLMQTGQQQQAVDLLEEPAKLAEAGAKLLEALGKAYAETGELERSAEILRRGVERYSENADLQLALAQTELQRQQFVEAEKSARRASELGRADNAVYTTLSSALVRLGRREEALEVRGKIVAPQQQAEAKDEQYRTSFRNFASHTYGMLANVHRANGSGDRAEEYLLESLSIDPSATSSLLGLADLFYQQRRIADAITVYQRLLEVQPENIFNYNNLASLAVSTGDVALADDALKRATEHDPTGNATLRYADFLVRTGRAVEAVMYAESAIKLLGNADAYLVYLSAQRASGDIGGAALTLRKAREAFPNDARLINVQL